MTLIAETAPAKVNLTLKVVGRRADGLHEIESLVVFARDAGDHLELSPAGPAGLWVIGPFAQAIVGTNIVTHAVEALRRSGLNLGAITLVKNLPVASGIGGGSADAAALLRAARSAHAHAARAIPWRDIAAALGADVPACVASTPALVTGTGDRIQPIADFPLLQAVLVNPMVAVPADKTARVFRALGLPAVLAPSERATPSPMFSDAADVLSHVARHGNDLTTAARTIVPAIDAVLSALDALPGCRVSRLSGAGATCFGLFETAAEAKAASAALERSHPDWWIRPTRLG